MSTFDLDNLTLNGNPTFTNVIFSPHLEGEYDGMHIVYMVYIFLNVILLFLASSSSFFIIPFLISKLLSLVSSGLGSIGNGTSYIIPTMLIINNICLYLSYEITPFFVDLSSSLFPYFPTDLNLFTIIFTSSILYQIIIIPVTYMFYLQDYKKKQEENEGNENENERKEVKFNETLWYIDMLISPIINNIRNIIYLNLYSVIMYYLYGQTQWFISFFILFFLIVFIEITLVHILNGYQYQNIIRKGNDYIPVLELCFIGRGVLYKIFTTYKYGIATTIKFIKEKDSISSLLLIPIVNIPLMFSFLYPFIIYNFYIAF